MIDTPMVPTDAVKWRDEIQESGTVRYIINTHHHVDHITGNYFFPGTIVSHEGMRELFTAPATSFVGSDRIEKAEALDGTVDYIRWRVSEPFPESSPLFEGYDLKAPTITFSERLGLHLGEHTVELLHLPGHTAAHIGVYIPQEKVFFAGDNFTNRTQPSLAHSLPLEWVESLTRIEAMDIDVVVPGHGEVCGKGVIREFRLFLQQCIQIIGEAIKKGLSKEEAADTISFEELYPVDRCDPAVHPGSKMQRRNVLRLYEMLSR